MITQKHPVPDHLAPFIESYLIKEVEVNRSKALFPAVSNSYFMFHYGDSYQMRLSNGNEVDFIPVTLSGISTMYSTFVKDEVRVRFAGAQLKPFTPYLLIGQRVGELTNTTMNGVSLYPEAISTHHKIQKATDNEEAVHYLNEFFTSVFESIEYSDFGLGEALEIISNPKEFETLEARLERIDENTRNFRRKFRKHMGLSPKRYMRILRMEKVLMDQFSHPDLDYLSRIYGFYDQSHFIRECKHFTGRTPRQIIGIFQNQNTRKYHTNLADGVKAGKP